MSFFRGSTRLDVFMFFSLSSRLFFNFSINLMLFFIYHTGQLFLSYFGFGGLSFYIRLGLYVIVFYFCALFSLLYGGTYMFLLFGLYVILFFY